MLTGTASINLWTLFHKAVSSSHMTTCSRSQLDTHYTSHAGTFSLTTGKPMELAYYSLIFVRFLTLQKLSFVLKFLFLYLPPSLIYSGLNT